MLLVFRVVSVYDRERERIFKCYLLKSSCYLIYRVRFIWIVTIIKFQLTTRTILKVNYVINFLSNNCVGHTSLQIF